MKDIRLSKAESAIQDEVGSRGDAFRAANRDRAAEETRLTGKMTEILDSSGTMVDSVAPSDPVPESLPPPVPAGPDKTAPATKPVTPR